MRIEKLDNEKPKNIEVGDIMESLDTGNLYLITRTEGDDYGWVILNKNKSSHFCYKTLEEVIDSTCDNYVVHKADDIKLTIAK